MTNSTISALESFAINPEDGTSFRRLNEFVDKVKEAAPLSRKLRSDTELNVKSFIETVLRKYIASLVGEMKEALLQDEEILTAFSELLDPQNSPRSNGDLNDYGIESLQVLADHYGAPKSDTFEKVCRTRPPLVDPAALVAEYNFFKFDAFQCRAAHEAKAERELAKMPDKSEKEKGAKEKRREELRYGPQELLSDMLKTPARAERPNMMKLLQFQVKSLKLLENTCT